MTRRDEGRVSLVEFLRSLKSLKGSNGMPSARRGARFAKFDPRVKGGDESGSEEFQLVRSAN
jgi:hypothetical protein